MGRSLGTSLGRSSTVAEPSPPRPIPSPHLLSCGAVLGGPGPPNRLLYDPCPMAGGGHSWSRWRWIHWGPHKITPPYHSGPSARHSCWWTLGNPGTHTDAHTHSLCPAGFTHRGGTRRTLMYERFGLEGCVLMCVWWGGATCASLPYTLSIRANYFKCCVHTHMHTHTQTHTRAHKCGHAKEHLCVCWHNLAQRLIPPQTRRLIQCDLIR